MDPMGVSEVRACIAQSLSGDRALSGNDFTYRTFLLDISKRS